MEDGCTSPGGLVGGVGTLIGSIVRWTGDDWLSFSVRNRSDILSEGNPSFSISTVMSVYPGKSINFSLWPAVMYEFNVVT